MSVGEEEAPGFATTARAVCAFISELSTTYQ